MEETKKRIEVVAAVIIREDRLFATQRGYGQWKDWWEFPGGKIEGTYVHDDDTLRYDDDTLRYDNDTLRYDNDTLRYDNDNDDDDGDKGKWIPSETPEDALKREIREELQTEIEVGELLTTVEYDYPEFHLSMRCFVCSVISGQLSLLEHEDARWLRKDELDSVRWLPADLEILPLIAEHLPGC